MNMKNDFFIGVVPVKKNLIDFLKKFKIVNDEPLFWHSVKPLLKINLLKIFIFQLISQFFFDFIKKKY